MLIGPNELDQVRQLVSDNASVEKIHRRVKGFTLGAALEFCCAGWEWRANQNQIGYTLFERWRKEHTVLDVIWDALQNGKSPKILGKSAMAPLGAEVCSVQTKVDLLNDDFELFKMRFARSVEIAGFGQELGRAIAVALGEMADNIVEHACQAIPAHGIVTYQVSDGALCFGVADVGRGILNSLQTNPRWSSLTSDVDALTQAVQYGATSRRDALHGQGFHQVHRSLASHDGALRFRSGKAALSLKGVGATKSARAVSTAALCGFQTSVTCWRDAAMSHFPLDSFF